MKHSHNNLLGISLMLLDTLSIALLYTVIKFVTKDIQSNYIVFFYKFSLLILTLPWVLHKGGLDNIKTPHFKVHLLRGFFSVGGSLSFMYGLQYVKLLDATVLQNVEQIMLVAIGMLFFNETVTRTKIFAIILSVLGVLIIVRPESIYLGDFRIFTSSFNEGYLFIFMAALFWVGNNIVIKKLGKKSTTKAQLFYLMLFSSIFAYPVAFVKWESIDLMNVGLYIPSGIVSFGETGIEFSHIKMILAMSFFYLLHSISLFHSLRHGEFSVIMPFVYFKLLWAGLLGYVVFSNVPKLESVAGYILIATAGILLMKREIRNRKKLALASDESA